MRAVFGIIGLVFVVAIVGVLAKKQLAAGVAPQAVGAPAGTERPAGPRQQVQQFEQAVQGAMQQARPMPSDDK